MLFISAVLKIRFTQRNENNTECTITELLINAIESL